MKIGLSLNLHLSEIPWSGTCNFLDEEICQMVICSFYQRRLISAATLIALLKTTGLQHDEVHQSFYDF